MKSFIVNILEDGDEKLFSSFLSKLKNVTVEKIDNSVYNDLNEDEISLLNERIESIETNTAKYVTLDDFKKNIRLKYDL